MFNMDLLALLIYINKNSRFRFNSPKSSFINNYNLDKITTAYMDLLINIITLHKFMKCFYLIIKTNLLLKVLYK